MELDRRIKTLFSALGLSLAAFAQEPFDATVLEVAAQRYVEPGTYTFRATIKNLGTYQLNSVRFNWRLDNGPINSADVPAFDEPYVGFPAAQGIRRRVVWPIPITFPTTGTYTITAWCSHLNGSITDMDPSNDECTQVIHVLPYVPEKHVLMDFFTHQICIPCADDEIALDGMRDMFPGRVHTMAVHAANNDPWSTDIGEAFNDTMHVYAHPKVFADRFMFPYIEVNALPTNNYLDPYGSYFSQQPWLRAVHRLEYTQPVEVNIEDLVYDPGYRSLSFTVRADFYGNLSGEYALNAYLVEDSIYGYQAGAPMPHWHRNVLRTSFNDMLGELDDVPFAMQAGDTHTRTFTMDELPMFWNARHVKIYAILQHWDPYDYLDRTIINMSERSVMEGAVGISEHAERPNGVNVWPSIADEQVTIDLSEPLDANSSLALITAEGRVQQLAEHTGVRFFTLPVSSLASGVYTVVLRTPGGTHTTRFIKR